MAEACDIDAMKEPNGSDSHEPLIEEQSVGATTESSDHVGESIHDERGK